MENPIDWSRPEDIRTRDGRKVVIYCTDAPGDFPVHGRVDQHKHPLSWSLDGSPSCAYFGFELYQSTKRGRVEGWVNVYSNGLSDMWPTRDAADRYTFARIACVKVSIEYEEGEGL